uniref:Acyl-CoA-binding domain-containing protein n=1 Tax=Brassica oleracea var. oleracea TaxID=109376 RepID=A0A0D3CTR6_BRAOL
MGISFSSLMTRIRRSTASSPLVVDIMKVEGKKERVTTSLKSENSSLRSQLAAEQSRYFKLEVEDAEVRQNIKTMETLEKKLGFIHRQRAVVSEQAAANMNGKRQSYGEWKWTKLLKRTEEINKAFANEVSWDPSSTSSTQAPTHRPSERTYGSI